MGHGVGFGGADASTERPYQPVNLVYPRMAVISLHHRIELPRADAITLSSLHYASPHPMSMARIQLRAKQLIRREGERAREP